MRAMTTPSDFSTTTDDTPRTRRNLLRLAGAAAVGTAVAVVGSAGNAAAAGALTTDSVGNSASGPTGLQVNGSAISYGIGVTDNGLGSVPTAVNRSAVLGHALDGAFHYGVSGYLDTTTVGSDGAGVKGYASIFGIGVTGYAENYEGVVGTSAGTLGRSVGVVGIGKTGVMGSGREVGVSAYSEDPGGLALYAAGRCGAIKFASWAGPPSTRTEAYEASVLDNDGNDGLWWSYAGGTPGKWQKIAGPGTAGAFHPITPTRVYDSRRAGSTPAGVLSTAMNPRYVSIKDQRDIATGNVTTTDIVPEGATAIACNVTVTNTVGTNGYLAINPGGTATVSASTINWSASGLTLANGVILMINPDTRDVTVVPGGTNASCHFILDVTGYWR